VLRSLGYSKGCDIFDDMPDGTHKKEKSND